jgi:hypothetical protein
MRKISSLRAMTCLRFANTPLEIFTAPLRLTLRGKDSGGVFWGLRVMAESPFIFCSRQGVADGTRRTSFSTSNWRMAISKPKTDVQARQQAAVK